MSIRKSLLWILPLAVVLSLFACAALVGCSCSQEETETNDTDESASQSEEGTATNDAQGSQGASEDADASSSSSTDADNAGATGGSNDFQADASADSYYEMCDDYVGEYGEPTCDDSSSYASLTGLCFAQLFDFDGDGTDELIVAYASDDAPSLQSGAASGDDGLSSHYVVEVWKHGNDAVNRVYRGASVLSSEGSELVIWGSSQYGGYVMSGQYGLEATQYYYSIGDQGSSLFAEVTSNDDDDLLVNGEPASDDWLDVSDQGEYVLAGYGMSNECEKTIEAFNSTLDTLRSGSAQ